MYNMCIYLVIDHIYIHKIGISHKILYYIVTPEIAHLVSLTAQTLKIHGAFCSLYI